MSDSPDISANIKLDTSSYTRSVQAGIRASDEFDSALDALVKAADKAEKKLQDLSADVTLNLDTGSLLDADRLLQSLDTTISPLVDINVVNEAAARGLLEEFNSTLTSKINVEDSELRDAAQLIDRLDSETVAIKTNADMSGLGEIETQLDALKKLAVIDIAMNLVGSIPSPADIPLLGSIIEADKAARSLTASLGSMGTSNTATYTAGAQDVYTSNFGESQVDAAEKYAEVVRITKNDTGELTKTNESFAQVTKDGFVVAALSGEDFNKVIRAADTLVQTGLAPSYTEAFDQITTGFQNGLDKGEDFLDTIVEYSGQFEDLGFTAEEFFSVLKGGLDAGAYNTDFIADLVKEMNIRAQAAMAGEGVEFDAFKALGLMDEVKAFNAGELTGAQFMSGVIDTLKTETASGKLNPQEFFDALGTKAEDLTLPVVIALDPAQIQTELTNVKGATLNAGIALGGDLGSSIAGLQRIIEVDLANSVSQAFDIPGKIKQLSDGVSRFSSLMADGATIPEAIAVAFEIPGFVDTVARLESGLGNLGIVLMEVAASILDAIGRGDAATGIRGTIADAAETQLAFDLKLADDGEAFSQAVRTALNRGVAESDVNTGILTAGSELIAAGDLEGAALLRDTLAEMTTITFPEDIQAFLRGEGIDPTNINASRDALIAYKAEVDRTAEGGGGMWTAFNTNNLGDVINATDIAALAQTAFAPLDTELTNAEDAITTHFENMRLSAEAKLPGMAAIATSSTGAVSTSMVDLSQVFGAADTAFATTNTNIATAGAGMSATLTTVTGSVDAFAANNDLQFGENTGIAVATATENIGIFGENFSLVMLTAGEEVNALIDTLLSIGNLDIAVPPIGVGGGSGGEGAGGSYAAGGTIAAGSMADVHAGETIMAGGEDISVLNRQTSSVIDSAIAGYMAGAGVGGGNSTVNNYVNLTFNNMGGAASTASLDQTKGIRGY